MDALIISLSSGPTAERNAAIAKMGHRRTRAEYIAIHHQVLAHAMKSDLDIPVHPEQSDVVQACGVPQVIR